MFPISFCSASDKGSPEPAFSSKSVQRELALGALGAASAGALVAGTARTLEASIVTEGAGFDGLGGRTGVAGGGCTVTGGGSTGDATSAAWRAGGASGAGWLGVGSGVGLMLAG